MSAISEIESLSGLVAFCAVVEAESFAAAARNLGVSPSAVSKSVGRLEARLGSKLLLRTTRSLEPTSEGQAYYQKVSVLLREMVLAGDSLKVARHDFSGQVKVSVPTVLGRRVIVPALREFWMRYPDIHLDLRLDDRKVDLITEKYDLALRLGPQQDSGLIGRKLGQHRFVTCATPDYLATCGPIGTVQDLTDKSCVVYRFPTTGQIESWQFTTQKTFHPKRTLVLNDGEALTQAALAGLGIVQIPVYQASTWLSTNALVEVLPGTTAPRGDAWLIWPPALSGIPRLHAVITFLTETINRSL